MPNVGHSDALRNGENIIVNLMYLFSNALIRINYGIARIFQN